jgi:hypothetical protein
MSSFRYLAVVTLAGACFAAAAPKVQAQVSINIGAPPVCPYGYYSYPPYNCAPYGYYGPQWFLNGVFIGAGPWFHGPANFHGPVNNRLDMRHDYHGALPHRGQRAAKPVNRISHFQGNETRDGRGHVTQKGR